MKDNTQASKLKKLIEDKLSSLEDKGLDKEKKKKKKKKKNV